MAIDTYDPVDGTPIFIAGGAPEVGLDETLAARHATFRGGLLRGTEAERVAFEYPTEGLMWAETDTDFVYKYKTGNWRRTAKTRGGIVQTNFASNGSTAIAHGLGATPDWVQLTVANHSESDGNTLNWRPVLWGNPSSTSFSVRLVDNRTDGYLGGTASAKISWTAGFN